MVENNIKKQIVEFVYEYQTLDPDVIRQAVPDAEMYSVQDIQNLIQEDFETISRKIEHYENHPDYKG